MVMNESLRTYAKENGSFYHIAAWKVMRKSTKWHPVPKFKTLKRTKTSWSGKYMTSQSDSNDQYFLNLNESDEEVEMNMPPPSPQRMPGRNNKGKRPQAPSSTDYKDTLKTISKLLQKFGNLQGLNS
ncbi:hypothetical protein R6Q59_031492 [Mikania micrantha]